MVERLFPVAADANWCGSQDYHRKLRKIHQKDLIQDLSYNVRHLNSEHCLMVRIHTVSARKMLNVASDLVPFSQLSDDEQVRRMNQAYDRYHRRNA